MDAYSCALDIKFCSTLLTFGDPRSKSGQLRSTLALSQSWQAISPVVQARFEEK